MICDSQKYDRWYSAEQKLTFSQDPIVRGQIGFQGQEKGGAGNQKNFEVNDKDFEEAALQFVRKTSGILKPNQEQESRFNTAVKNIAKETKKLIENIDS